MRTHPLEFQQLLHPCAYQSMQCVVDTNLPSTTMHPLGIHRGILLRKTTKKSCDGIVLGRASRHYQHYWLPTSALDVGRCRCCRRMRRCLLSLQAAVTFIDFGIGVLQGSLEAASCVGTREFGSQRLRRCMVASRVSVVARILKNPFSNFARQFSDIKSKHR